MRIKIRYTIVCCFVLLYQVGWAQTFNQKENAVYIYNFVKYTQWPQKKTSFIIGIIGDTPVENELKSLLAKKNNSIIVKKITIAETKNVDVIIVSESSSRTLKEIQKETAKFPILIITEKPDLNYSGACISLFMDEDDDFKTKFQVSPFNLRSRGLLLNPQIMNNAILVR
jgi:hypothetical protein